MSFHLVLVTTTLFVFSLQDMTLKSIDMVIQRRILEKYCITILELSDPKELSAATKLLDHLTTKKTAVAHFMYV